MFKGYVDQYLTFKPGGGYPHLKSICEFVECAFGRARSNILFAVKEKSFKGVADEIGVITDLLIYLYGDTKVELAKAIILTLNAWRMSANRQILGTGDHDNWLGMMEMYSMDAQLMVITSLVQFSDQEGLAARWASYGQPIEAPASDEPAEELED